MLLTHTDWYYFDPGSFDEAKALAKEFKPSIGSALTRFLVRDEK